MYRKITAVQHDTLGPTMKQKNCIITLKVNGHNRKLKN